MEAREGAIVTKKNYEAAARIVQTFPIDNDTREIVIDTYVEFFSNDSPRFNEQRFRTACIPGNNVKARG